MPGLSEFDLAFLRYLSIESTYVREDSPGVQEIVECLIESTEYIYLLGMIARANCKFNRGSRRHPLVLLKEYEYRLSMNEFARQFGGEQNVRLEYRAYTKECNPLGSFLYSKMRDLVGMHYSSLLFPCNRENPIEVRVNPFGAIEIRLHIRSCLNITEDINTNREVCLKRQLVVDLRNGKRVFFKNIRHNFVKRIPLPTEIEQVLEEFCMNEYGTHLLNIIQETNRGFGKKERRRYMLSNVFYIFQSDFTRGATYNGYPKLYDFLEKTNLNITFEPFLCTPLEYHGFKLHFRKREYFGDSLICHISLQME